MAEEKKGEIKQGLILVMNTFPKGMYEYKREKDRTGNQARLDFSYEYICEGNVFIYNTEYISKESV